MSLLREMREKLDEREYHRWLAREIRAFMESHFWEITEAAIGQLVEQWETPLYQTSKTGLADIAAMLQARGAVSALGELKGEIMTPVHSLEELEAQEREHDA